MRNFATWLAATMLLAVSSAATASDARGEIGYARGALGYDALIAGDLERAEQQIADARNVARDDPARLINLAYIHMQTGRMQSARALFEMVRDHRTSFIVELANGETAETREVARRALARMNRAYATR